MTVGRATLALVAAIAVAGCGDDDSPPAASAPVAAQTPTAPTTAPTATAIEPAPGTTVPAPGKAGRKPVAPGGKNDGAKKTYSGDGSETLPLELKRNAVLRWTVTGGTRFRLSDPSGKLNVNGGARGQTFAVAGKYPRARVTADGKWRLTVELLAAP